MQHMRFSWESMYSRSKQRLDIQRTRQLVTMPLATLGTVLLFGLASHGPAVIDAVAKVNRMMAPGDDQKGFRGNMSYV